ARALDLLEPKVRIVVRRRERGPCVRGHRDELVTRQGQRAKARNTVRASGEFLTRHRNRADSWQERIAPVIPILRAVRSAPALVSRFRSSQAFAATSDA